MATSKANGGGAQQAENGKNDAGDAASKAPEGITIPPPKFIDVIETMAAYIARNPLLGDVVRERNSKAPLTAFLDPAHPYNAYYQWRISEFTAGRAQDPKHKRSTDVTFRGREVKIPDAPEEWQFSARMPNISAQDLDIVKLTALYAAKNGRSWITMLSHREAGNFQFDFLRAQHSLNLYFVRLTEQYKELLDGETVDNGRPQKKRIAELEANVKDRFNVLERAKKRAEYVKWQQKQKVEKSEKAEKEKLAFAQIDWHNFGVAETVTFNEDDMMTEMVPPKTLNDMQSLSLEQKAQMRVGFDKRIEEAVPDFTGYGDGEPSIQQNQYAPQDNTAAARAAQEAASRAAKQPGNIRTGYVPQAQLRRQVQNWSICPNCHQRILNDELEEHVRIELLDPQWREQSAKNHLRSSTTNLSTHDVANNLKRLASQRTDLFDPVTGQALSEEEQARRKRAEINAYDGVSTPGHAVYGPAGPAGQSERPDVQAQIQALHARYKGQG